MVRKMNRNGLLLMERFYAGYRKFVSMQHRWQISICAFVLAVLYVTFRELGDSLCNFGVSSNGVLLPFVLTVALIMIVMLIFLLLGIPKGSRSINTRIACVGLSNRMGEQPILVSREEIDENFYRITFLTIGGSVERWKDRKPEIESALNIYIDNIRYVDDERYLIAIACTDAKNGIPKECQWHDYYLKKNTDFTVYLGIGIGGAVTVELQRTPHILIGGSTGSGKTVLLRCLLWQCHLQGAEIIVADFKGGMDYSKKFKEITKLLTSSEQFDQELDRVVELMKERMDLLSASGCSNIWTYNKLHPDEPQLQHVVVAIDEMGEVLDKTGLTRDAKKDVERLEGKVASIARLGRALGIHLFLATQRPDANILAGQIKSNIDIRICGRADEVLSRIILDSSDAADLIPKDEQGLFLINDGKLIRTFNFKEGDTK
ncbi:MAG: type IV secretion system DNA-binding domain-containing protein [Eubacterium sp.]|nr:type IV secretion system DNA-binding domain-containing protein [Eubacterium sp.]